VPPERIERKLAAILAADVAGYSRLMGADEESTLARLKACRRELRLCVQKFRSRRQVLGARSDGIRTRNSGFWATAIRELVDGQRLLRFVCAAARLDVIEAKLV
jgi:hypothetical protein